MMESILTKRRKTRRGKKKHYNRRLKTDDWTCGCGQIDETSDFDQPDQCRPKSNLDHLDNNTPTLGMLGHKLGAGSKGTKSTIRPANITAAPHNSNQFLIDDRLTFDQPGGLENTEHKVEKEYQDIHACWDENSFYNNNVPMMDLGQEETEQCLSPQCESAARSQFCWKTSPAYSDVDYEYTSLPDNDITFQERDFEQVFQNAKVAQIEDKSKHELITNIKSLLQDLSSLKQKVASRQNIKKDDNHSTAAQLESELLDLKRENQRLKDEQSQRRIASS